MSVPNPAPEYISPQAQLHEAEYYFTPPEISLLQIADIPFDQAQEIFGGQNPNIEDIDFPGVNINIQGLTTTRLTAEQWQLVQTCAGLAISELEEPLPRGNKTNLFDRRIYPNSHPEQTVIFTFNGYNGLRNVATVSSQQLYSISVVTRPSNTYLIETPNDPIFNRKEMLNETLILTDVGVIGPFYNAR